MKALSVMQPWAWMLFHGKDYENRSRVSHYSGLCLIQASKQPHARHAEAYEIAKRCGMNCPPLDELHYGGIIGVVRFGPQVREGSGPWFFGPFAWPIEASQVLPFTPCRGHQGFFDFPDSDYFKLLGKVVTDEHPDPASFTRYWTKIPA